MRTLAAVAAVCFMRTYEIFTSLCERDAVAVHGDAFAAHYLLFQHERLLRETATSNHEKMHHTRTVERNNGKDNMMVSDLLVKLVPYPPPEVLYTRWSGYYCIPTVLQPKREATHAPALTPPPPHASHPRPSSSFRQAIDGNVFEFLSDTAFE